MVDHCPSNLKSCTDLLLPKKHHLYLVYSSVAKLLLNFCPCSLIPLRTQSEAHCSPLAPPSGQTTDLTDMDPIVSDVICLYSGSVVQSETLNFGLVYKVSNMHNK